MSGEGSGITFLKPFSGNHSLKIPKKMQRPFLRALLLCFSVLLSGPTLQAQQARGPVAEALRQFEAYKPTIEAREDAIVEGPEAISGDLNGDGLTDCLLHFILLPQGGGNAIIGRQTAVYLNNGTGMKVDGAFPELDVCYVPEAIEKGVIRMRIYECAPPYNTEKGVRYYRWKSRKLERVR